MRNKKEKDRWKEKIERKKKRRKIKV